jgi:cyanate lyase
VSRIESRCDGIVNALVTANVHGNAALKVSIARVVVRIIDLGGNSVDTLVKIACVGS